MDNNALIVVLSLVVTFLTSVFKVVSWSTKQKAALATVLSVAAGTAAAWQAGQLDPNDVFGSIAAVYAVSNFAYVFIVRGTKLNKKLASMNLFGVNTEHASEILADAAKVEKKVRKAVAATKAPSPAKKTTAKKATTK